MNEHEFRCFIENKYIELIKQHIDKNDETIILSSSSKNGVIDFFEREGYSYKFTEKHFAGREKNAIVDLLISKRCNNIFIGNFNPVKLNGSSFSYFISKSLHNDVKEIMIDLDRIRDAEIIQ
jgi:ribosomal protein S8